MERNLESWKKEFYPIDAYLACGSAVEAAQHSLKKWSGFTVKNMMKHHITKVVGSGCIMDSAGNKMYTSCQNCALCKLVYSFCENCPFALVSSTQNSFNMHCGECYDDWRYYGNPVPMIRALRKLVNILKKQELEKLEKLDRLLDAVV